MPAMSAQAKRCMRWILAATCFFAVTFVAGHFYSSWMNRRFEYSGIRTVAMVTDVTVEHHKEQYIRSYGAGKGRCLMRQAPYTKNDPVFLRGQWSALRGKCKYPYSSAGTSKNRRTYPSRIPRGETVETPGGLLPAISSITQYFYQQRPQIDEQI